VDLNNLSLVKVVTIFSGLFFSLAKIVAQVEQRTTQKMTYFFITFFENKIILYFWYLQACTDFFYIC
jgi:hypothetical protein